MPRKNVTKFKRRAKVRDWMIFRFKFRILKRYQRPTPSMTKVNANTTGIT